MKINKFRIFIGFLVVSFSSVGQRVDSGSDHAILVCKNGEVYTAGDNYDGQLGNDTSIAEDVFKKVPGLSDIISAQAGGWYSIALRKDSTVWVWGNNYSTQLGLGDSAALNVYFPTKLDSIGPVTQISAGPFHALYLQEDSTVWGCGSNQVGELGLIPPPYGFSRPHQVPGLSNAIKVYAGHTFSLVLKSDSTVWAFGTNGWGQLGRGTTGASPHPPAQVLNLSSIIDITAGGHNSFAVAVNGDVWGWGQNNYGQLGTAIPKGQNEYTAIPVKINGIDSVKSISSTGDYVLALRSDGSVWAWGGNTLGHLGNGTTSSTSIPFKIPGLADIVEISSGVVSIAVDAQGQVYTWGTSPDGALATGSVTQKLVPGPITPIACNPVVSLPEVKDKAKPDIEVFPNPTSGLLFIKNNRNNTIDKFELISITGETLMKAEMPGYRVDISGFPEGIYVLKLLVNGQYITRRVLLE